MTTPTKGKMYLPPPGEEERYLNLLLDPLDSCAQYRPKFGTGEEEGVTLERFHIMYSQDPFYHWIGLDSDLMYAAHKAAGGMTSIYKQLGTGCDRLFRAVLQDALLLSDEEIAWSFEYEKKDGTFATATLDARIDVAQITRKPKIRARVSDWLSRCGESLGLNEERIGQLKGAVFEVRQGYKSEDSKRSNADLAFTMNAAAENYLPVFCIISTQVSRAILRRYRNSRTLVMIGTLPSNDDTASTYAFFRDVIGFELDAFFQRNADKMRIRCQRVLEALLTPT